jgi:hypothetical protein
MGFQNKQGEDGEVVTNKAHLVAQGFNQVEGLDFVETFALVAGLEAIRILLAFAVSKGFKLYQMDLYTKLIICKYLHLQILTFCMHVPTMISSSYKNFHN